MTDYKFEIRTSGIVQRVHESGDVYVRLTVHEIARRERVRANKRIAYARSFSHTMPTKGVNGYEIALTRLHTLHSRDRNPDKLRTSIQNLQWVSEKNNVFWARIHNGQKMPLRHNERVTA